MIKRGFTAPLFLIFLSMATIKMHVSKIKEKITNFHPSNDLSVPDLFILEKMNDVRETLIRREQQVKNNLEMYYQYDCCYQIKCLKTSCTIDGVTFIADGALHYIEMPDLIPGIENPITFLGDQDGRKYSRLSLNSFLKQEHLGAAGMLPAYTIVGDKIWMKNATISGKLFACMNVLKKNPLSPCEDWDKEYPVPSTYNLELMVTKDILSSYGIHIDATSNESDDRNISSEVYKQYEQSQQQEQQQKND